MQLKTRLGRAMTEDPSPAQVANVAERVAARMQEMGYSPGDVYRNSGPAAQVVVDLVENHRWIRRSDARRRLSFALRLQPDGIDRWARGEEALLLEGPTSTDDLSRRLEAQTEDIHGLRAQVEGLEHLLQRVLRALEGKRSPRRGDGPPPPAPPAS